MSLRPTLLTAAFALALPAVALAAQPAPSAEAKAGRALFNRMGCYQCHGGEGQGSRASGPALAPNPPPLPAMTAYVRRPAGQMPAYSPEILSDQQLSQIHDFLASIRPGLGPDAIPLLGGTAKR